MITILCLHQICWQGFLLYNLVPTPNHSPKKGRKVDGSGQISIIPKPELRGFWGDSLTKPQFKVASADVVIICPDGSVAPFTF